MKPVELVFVNSATVKCDGGKDSSKHPLIYLNIKEGGNVTCPYCGKYFTTKKSHDGTGFSKDIHQEVQLKNN
ncbi:MAG: zinc-finger domain-containing protein [Proteobacteria bacterium]|nr:zinc-finger domain-containing protein [Pseudomonadota bacterium]